MLVIICLVKSFHELDIRFFGPAVRSRHIERRYLKILEWVAEGKIIVKYKNTKENHADMFTKPLESAVFDSHAGAIMGF